MTHWWIVANLYLRKRSLNLLIFKQQNSIYLCLKWHLDDISERLCCHNICYSVINTNNAGIYLKEFLLCSSQSLTFVRISYVSHSLKVEFEDTKEVIRIRKSKDRQHNDQKFENTKGVIRIRKSKNRQHNSKKIKEKGRNNDIQNIEIPFWTGQNKLGQINRYVHW